MRRIEKRHCPDLRLIPQEFLQPKIDNRTRRDFKPYLVKRPLCQRYILDVALGGVYRDVNELLRVTLVNNVCEGVTVRLKVRETGVTCCCDRYPTLFLPAHEF